jgi:hypothetical protein
MSVRDKGFDPRKTHPRSGAYPVGATPRAAAAQTGPAGRGSSLIGPKAVAGVAAVVLLVLVAIGFSGGLHLGSSGASSAPGASASAGLGLVGSAAPGSSGSGSASSDAPSDSATPGDSSAPSSAPTTSIANVAFVPVTSFRSGRTTTRATDVKGIASGASPYASLVLVKADAAAELQALGLDAGSLGTKLVKVADANALMTTLSKHATWLGFLRADQVAPAVKALAWGTSSLFGEVRVAAITDWPLRAKLAVSSDQTAYDPGKAWTVFAAGDLALDRGAALAIKTHGNDSNYLYSGGTVKITGHCRNCSPFGWDLPYTTRTGHTGAVRSLISGADLSIANMEEVAVKNWSYHPHGTVFTGNPAYLVGIKNAGFDWVSMGNNHVGDFGPGGVLQSMGYLTQHGLLHGGAGANTAAAHKPSIVTVNGIKVALLSYDTVANVYNATATKAGSARMTNAWLKKDIKAARAAGAQVVIVWPHWGVEYTAGPSATQQRLAHNAIDAGADLVIGNHPHWAQAMEVYKGKPIWYALGNFTFDQTWSEPTMEGISLELTFSGTHLVQAWMHPHLVLDYSQPNLMDPLGSGKAVLNQIFGASKDLAW